VHSMHIRRKTNFLVKNQDSALQNLDDLKLMSAQLASLNYTDKRLVFLYDRNRQCFDPFLIDIVDERPLINNMKRIPVDISEPVLFLNISTVSLSFFEKYKISRFSDDLSNSRDSIVQVVKSKELTKFSFYLSPEDLFISDALNKGKLYRANWLTRPRVNLEEFIKLNSQFYTKFGRNFPNYALHLANIVANGSSLVMVSRSQRSIKSSQVLTKIERMFFWHSVPGDGVYNLYSSFQRSGKPFDLSDDNIVMNLLITEILKDEVNNNYYLPPQYRETFKNLYHSVRDRTTDEIPSEPRQPCLDKKRLYLPGRKHIKAQFETVFSEVSGHENEFEDLKGTIVFNGQNETTSLTKEGSKQIRRNLFMLYRWLSRLNEAAKYDSVDISTLRYKIKKCKFLIYVNILIFKSGNIEPFSGDDRI